MFSDTTQAIEALSSLYGPAAIRFWLADAAGVVVYASAEPRAKPVRPVGLTLGGLIEVANLAGLMAWMHQIDGLPYTICFAASGQAQRGQAIKIRTAEDGLLVLILAIPIRPESQDVDAAFLLGHSEAAYFFTNGRQVWGASTLHSVSAWQRSGAEAWFAPLGLIGFEVGQLSVAGRSGIAQRYYSTKLAGYLELHLQVRYHKDEPVLEGLLKVPASLSDTLAGHTFFTDVEGALVSLSPQSTAFFPALTAWLAGRGQAIWRGHLAAVERAGQGRLHVQLESLQAEQSLLIVTEAVMGAGFGLAGYHHQAEQVAGPDNVLALLSQARQSLGTRLLEEGALPSQATDFCLKANKLGLGKFSALDLNQAGDTGLEGMPVTPAQLRALRREGYRVLRQTATVLEVLYPWAAQPQTAILCVAPLDQIRTGDSIGLGLLAIAELLSQDQATAMQSEPAASKPSMMMQEANHRIKNSLSLIASLLQLQGYELESEAAKDAIKEAQQRIYTVAELHEALYKSGQEGIQADIKPFLEGLAARLQRAVGSGRLEIRVEVESHNLPASSVTQIGLLVNELVLNAAKYAFTDKEKGFIAIYFYRSDGSYYLSVQDNGKGKPADAGASLGSTLIEEFAKQLKASTRIETSAGTRYQFVFPA